MPPRQVSKRTPKLKQTQRGPGKKRKTGGPQLDTTPTSRATQPEATQRGGSPSDGATNASNTKKPVSRPAIPKTPDAVDLVNHPGDEDYDEDSLEDLDMSAFEAQSSLQKSGRAKSFAWSEPDSLSRRSSPVPAGETPHADWLLEEPESVPNMYSSPRSGTGNLPSTMPLQEDQLKALALQGTLQDTVQDMFQDQRPRFDFSETASTGRRSTPFDSNLPEAQWGLGESKPATPNPTQCNRDASLSLSSAAQKTTAHVPFPESNVETAANPEPDPDSKVAREHETEEEAISSGSKPISAATTMEATSRQTNPRRRQRAKDPVPIDDETQRVKTDPSLVKTSHAADQRTQDDDSDEEFAKQRPKPKSAAAKRKPAKARSVTKKTQSKTKVKKASGPSKAEPSKPKTKDPDSSWKPASTNRRSSPKKATVAEQESSKVLPSAGPAANTRARGKATDVVSTATVSLPPKDVKSHGPNVEAEPPSGQSATSGYSELSSPPGVDSTYFADLEPNVSESIPAPMPSVLKQQHSTEGPVPSLTHEVRRSGWPPSTKLKPERVFQHDPTPLSRALKQTEEIQPPLQLVHDTLQPAAVAATKGKAQVTPMSATRTSHIEQPGVMPGILPVPAPSSKPAMSQVVKNESQITIEVSSDPESDDFDEEYLQDDCGTVYDPPSGHERQMPKDTAQRGQPERREGADHGLFVGRHDYQQDMPSQSQPRPPLIDFAPLPRLAPSQKPSTHDGIQGVRAQASPLTLRDPNILGRKPLAKKRHDSRMISISVARSPVITSTDGRKRKLDDVYPDPDVSLDDEPIQLVYTSRHPGSSDRAESRSSSDVFPGKPTGIKRSRRDGVSPMAVSHLVKESGSMAKDVAKELQIMAKKLYAADEVYDHKMRRCLSKITGREQHERKRLEEKNRGNVKTFGAMVAEGRKVIEKHVTKREKAMSGLERVWAQRSSGYDATLSRLEQLQRGMGLGQ